MSDSNTQVRKYNFSYELKTKYGELKISIVRAKHTKNAKTILKLRYPGCTIKDLDIVRGTAYTF